MTFGRIKEYLKSNMKQDNKIKLFFQCVIPAKIYGIETQALTERILDELVKIGREWKIM